MKIGEFAKKSNCLTVTIRYYEQIGLLPDGKRDARNHRIYDEDDGERLRFILHCRNHKIPLKSIRRLLDLRDGKGSLENIAVAMLKSHIEDLKRQRESIDQLIASLSAILEFQHDISVKDEGVLAILGSPCPHCPDYDEKLKNGGRIDKRAECLAPPAKR